MAKMSTVMRTSHFPNLNIISLTHLQLLPPKSLSNKRKKKKVPNLLKYETKN